MFDPRCELQPSHVQAAMASTSGLPLPGLGGDEGDLSSDEDNMGWNAEPMAFDEDAVHRNAAGAQPDGAEGAFFIPLHRLSVMDGWLIICARYVVWCLRFSVQY